MKQHEVTNNFNHNSKQSTSQINDQNFLKSSPSQPTKKYKLHHRLQTMKGLRERDQYINGLIGIKNSSNESERKKASEQRHEKTELYKKL